MSRLGGILLTILLIYFGYHALAGEQGLSNWRNMQVEAQQLQTELDEINSDIASLKAMIARLEGGELDRDYVEELVHGRLLFAEANEFMLAR